MLIKNMPDVPNGLNFDGITRCLKNGGLFITEQVGATNNYSLSSFLTDNYIPVHPENAMVNVISNLVERGFQILKSDSFYPKIRFYDIGALVYYAKVISWEFPDFSVLKYQSELMRLQRIIEGNEDRFLLGAKNNKITGSLRAAFYFTKIRLMALKCF